MFAANLQLEALDEKVLHHYSSILRGRARRDFGDNVVAHLIERRRVL